MSTDTLKPRRTPQPAAENSAEWFAAQKKEDDDRVATYPGWLQRSMGVAEPSEPALGEVVIAPKGDVEGWAVVRWTDKCPPVGTKLYAAPVAAEDEPRSCSAEPPPDTPLRARLESLRAILSELREVAPGVRNEAVKLVNDTLTELGTDHRAALIRLLYELHVDEILSEQQCAKRLGVDLVTWRVVRDQVEADEAAAGTRP